MAHMYMICACMVAYAICGRRTAAYSACSFKHVLLTEELPPRVLSAIIFSFKLFGSSHYCCSVLQGSVGQLQQGFQFDALIVDCINCSTFDVYASDTKLDMLEKFATVGDDRNISSVYVKGRHIK